MLRFIQQNIFTFSFNYKILMVTIKSRLIWYRMLWYLIILFSFNAAAPLSVEDPKFLYKSQPANKIHCLAFVLDSSGEMQPSTIARLKAIQRIGIQKGFMLEYCFYHLYLKIYIVGPLRSDLSHNSYAWLFKYYTSFNQSHKGIVFFF